MKIYRIAVWGCLLIVGQVGAQVVNDDCATAEALFPANGTGQCDVPALPGFVYPLLDSTDLAVVDFPYPISSMACPGYAGNTLAPAKDLWYKAYGRYGYSWDLQTADTCHLTVWVGGGCANLLPVSCFAVAAGSAIGDICGLNPTTDTLYLQVSNKSGIASDANFRLCFTSSCPPDAWANFQFDASTPVQCVTYNVGLQPCSENQSADGELHVEVTGGIPPVTIDWEDGGSAFNLSGLSAGLYPFILTDGQGCATLDTATIECSFPTSVMSVQVQPQPLIIMTMAGVVNGNFEVTPACSLRGSVILTNGLGQIVATGVLNDSWLSIPNMPRSIGRYAIRFTSPGTPSLLGYLLIM